MRAFDNVESRKGYSGPLSIRRFLQSWKVLLANDRDTAVGELPLVLDGESGSLARGPERSKGLGWDACVRLESSARQPQ